MLEAADALNIREYTACIPAIDSMPKNIPNMQNYVSGCAKQIELSQLFLISVYFMKN